MPRLWIKVVKEAHTKQPPHIRDVMIMRYTNLLFTYLLTYLLTQSLRVQALFYPGDTSCTELLGSNHIVENSKPTLHTK